MVTGTLISLLSNKKPSIRVDRVVGVKSPRVRAGRYLHSIINQEPVNITPTFCPQVRLISTETTQRRRRVPAQWNKKDAQSKDRPERKTPVCNVLHILYYNTHPYLYLPRLEIE